MADARPAPASAPPRPLLALLLASLVLCVFTAGFAVQYTRGWAQVRAGKGVAAQRASLLGVPWFKRPFTSFLWRLQRTVPPDARILVEASGVHTPLGNARWYLFMNHYAYPLRFYVRKPTWASGTLVDYPRWLAWAHEHPQLTLEESLAMGERGIEWRLRYPVRKKFELEEVELLHLEEGRWERVELAGPARERDTGAEREAPR